MSHTARCLSSSLNSNQLIVRPKCPVEEEHIQRIELLEQVFVELSNCRKIAQPPPRIRFQNQPEHGLIRIELRRASGRDVAGIASSERNRNTSKRLLGRLTGDLERCAW